MEEKMRILNLLKDGKITTDEASRLLDAVDQKTENREHREHQIRFKKHFMPGVEVIPETISKAMATAMAKLQENMSKLAEHESNLTDKEKKLKAVVIGDMEYADKKFPAKAMTSIRTVSGNVDVEGGDNSEIILECCGMNKTEERNDELLLSSVSNDIEIQTPEKINLAISSVSGDIDISNIKGNIDCESVSGDLELNALDGKIIFKSTSGDIEVNDLKGSAEIKNVSGDIEISYLEPADSKIETKSGDITIILPKKSDLTLELYSENGEIDLSELANYEELQKEENYVKVGLGKKTKTITIKTKSGDIEVKSEK